LEIIDGAAALVAYGARSPTKVKALIHFRGFPIAVSVIAARG
jgi:hypothetical protein